MKTLKEFRLRVTYLNKTISPRFGHKILKVTEGDNHHYDGFSKKECIEKAKKAYRYSSFYKKEWVDPTY